LALIRKEGDSLASLNVGVDITGELAWVVLERKVLTHQGVWMNGYVSVYLKVMATERP
jgi:hypothetical protein